MIVWFTVQLLGRNTKKIFTARGRVYLKFVLNAAT